MSGRCEIYFTFDLKADIPDEVVEAIRSMMDKSYVATSMPAAEFLDNDWQGILDSSYHPMVVFPGEPFSSLSYAYRLPSDPSERDTYRITLTFRTEIHYDALWEDYIHLLTWIAQYSETQGFIGYFRSEGTTSNPTLLYFKKGTLATQESFLPKADS
jgi:hypothetical protein